MNTYVCVSCTFAHANRFDLPCAKHAFLESNWHSTVIGCAACIAMRLAELAKPCVQAACRADLYSDKAPSQDSSVPVSQEGQMSALRQALRTADEDEREQRYQALLSQETE